MVADYSKAVSSGKGSGRRFDAPEREPGLFWWSIAIIILTGCAVFSWVFSIYVFSFPEKTFNYKLLMKFEKLEPLERFDRLKVPGGRERDAKTIYTTFYDYDDTLFRVKNDEFLRSYIWNYTEEPAPIYLIGEFEVIQSRTLTPDDIFTSGVVIHAKTDDYPNAFLELILPTDPGSVPAEHFRPGDRVVLEKSRSYVSVLHISRMGQDNLLISAVSVVYGRHRIDDNRFVNQSVPKVLNMEARFPIMVGKAEEPPESDPDSEFE